MTPTDALRALRARRRNFSLAQPFYHDPALYRLDLENIFYRDWIFAGHDCEIAHAGDFFTLQIGDYALIVNRDASGRIRAHHNSCRHRGYKICDAARGNVKRRFVCPYHQWSYDLDGSLARYREMGDDFDATQFGLKPVHAESVGGWIFVCVADVAPDFAAFRATIAPYLAPYDLSNAKVAFESKIIEKGNWKLVMENNRECYHCAGSHPELCRVFPETPVATAGAKLGSEGAHIAAFVAKWEAQGFPGQFQIADNSQYRIMRMPFLGDARAMTMTGEPAVSKRLGRAPETENCGDILLYHYPSTWNHITADHALSFRCLPLSATETELTTKWLVPKDAVEGRDYDLKTLTEVWAATNAQDMALVERNAEGIRSPAYEPGPYSPIHESGVIQFVDWYCGSMEQRLGGDKAVLRAAE
jgi:glycine betaine catabolism A